MTASQLPTELKGSGSVFGTAPGLDEAVADDLHGLSIDQPGPGAERVCRHADARGIVSCNDRTASAPVATGGRLDSL